MSQLLDNQWLFYYLFDLAMRFVLLNVVRGITVDTFSELRELKLERLRDTEQTCFICGLNKQIFDRDKISKGFKTHIAVEHNMWNYLFFMIHLWEQDKDDDDGLEQYVRRCVDAGDINWIPAHKAMGLLVTSLVDSEAGNETSQTKEIFTQNLSQVESTFMSKMSQFQSEISAAINTSLATNTSISHTASAATNPSTARPQLEKEYTRILSFNSLASLDEGEGIGGSSSVDRLSLNKAHTVSSIHFQFPQLTAGAGAGAVGPIVVIEIAEITGLTFPSRILETISCVIRTKYGATPLRMGSTRLLLHEQENHQSPIIIFDPCEVIVSQGYVSELREHQEEIVTIQITRGGAGGGAGVPRYVGKVEFQMHELCHEKEQRLQKYFYGEVHENTSRGLLVVNTRVLSPVRSSSPSHLLNPHLIHSASSSPLFLSDIT
jgi:hypothetical protein